MRQVLTRALALLRRPGVLAIVLLLAGGGSALVLLPLFGVPGFELSLALAIAMGLLGGGTGIAAAAQERRLLLGVDPRPQGATPVREPGAAVRLALGASLLLNVGVLVPPFLAATLFAVLRTACDPFELVGFYPLLTLPSALLASSAGVLCGFRGKRPARAAGLYALAVLVSAVPTLWPIVLGPQVFAFNHFLGHLPGPLYDEALAITPALAWFRLETLLWAWVLAGLAAATLDTGSGRLGRSGLRPALLAVLALPLTVIVLIETRGPELGQRMTDAYLAEELGGVRETEHFRLHYWRGKPREDVDRMARDLEFRWTQTQRFLGVAPTERLKVWLYKDEKQKQRLVGAGRTQFAKPWRHELHIQDRPFPHAVLHHELAHVMAAPAGSGPFRVTTRLGLWPLMGVIEGLAVASDGPVQGDLTLHQWAAGMRKQNLAPDMRKLMGPEGFYQSAPSRAYTVAGSFLLYLAETYGAAKLRAVYADGDFQEAYGRPLGELVTEWEGHVDALPLDAAAMARAFARFRTGSLFARACAREVARLTEAARDALASDPEDALARYRRAAELQPEEPGFRLGEATALSTLERYEDAATVLARLAEAERVKGQAVLEAEVAMARADVAMRREQPEEARRFLDFVLSKDAGPELTRTAQVKLAALESPARRAPIDAYFRASHEELRLLLLSRALTAVQKDPYLSYLLGRRLHQVGAPALAAEQLQQALADEGLPEALRKEALRLRVESAYLAGDCGAVRHEVGAMPDFGDAFRASTTEWKSRCDFEETTFRGPLVPRQAFR
ncbi:tetratricopeptide repeat protein [Pyxidicoccus xibeiensis]|uniref:tetratricopeptide repeat protein n=1 Tax=Pyxidicoccus xibeiensis TaxID=2906759 RepID=UPI0020A7CC27|nr:tetratricopeptide repeat protein [Pyxidicoccus xibeiensis]MCP3141340.1 tetratricopeptide repeat protein [Pyxidicoccus xibeiensis]